MLQLLIITWYPLLLGNNGKEKESSRSKEATSPAARSANGQYNIISQNLSTYVAIAITVERRWMSGVMIVVFIGKRGVCARVYEAWGATPRTWCPRGFGDHCAAATATPSVFPGTRHCPAPLTPSTPLSAGVTTSEDIAIYSYFCENWNSLSIFTDVYTTLPVITRIFRNDVDLLTPNWLLCLIFGLTYIITLPNDKHWLCVSTLEAI